MSDPIHTWFGLSYSNYLVLPRTLLQSMPEDWQERMVACLSEMQAAFAHVEQAHVYKVEASTEATVSDLTDAELAQVGITEDWYLGEVPPPGLAGDELNEWKAEHEDPDGPVYHDAHGNEVDGQKLVLLPAPDPVPHYNRGRTYIEPATPHDCEEATR